MEINEEKKVLLGLSSDELKAIVRDLGMPAFTAGQILKWLYQQHVSTIDEMTNLSKVNRERLKEQYVVGAMAPIDCQRSKDGTVKYLFPVRRSEYSGSSDDSEKFVETVFIPDGERATLCVSCQVGCKMNCLFCQTGKQGFEGNLTAADILNQIYALPERERLTNIVFMGQGEPMDNLDAILRATEILTADYGYAWSPRRITVSSVGVKNKLKRFLDESECHVAISMHSPLPEQRRWWLKSYCRRRATTSVMDICPSAGISLRRCSGRGECIEMATWHSLSSRKRLSFVLMPTLLTVMRRGLQA